jgi:hypothetical protein
VDGNNIGVIQGGYRSGFLLEAAQTFGIIGEGGG